MKSVFALGYFEILSEANNALNFLIAKRKMRLMADNVIYESVAGYFVQTALASPRFGGRDKRTA